MRSLRRDDRLPESWASSGRIHPDMDRRAKGFPARRHGYLCALISGNEGIGLLWRRAIASRAAHYLWRSALFRFSLLAPLRRCGGLAVNRGDGVGAGFCTLGSPVNAAESAH
jgi:hypothetical protein